MANSRFAYVRDFELPDPLLPGTFIVVRVDGRGFHRFSEEHGFAKPNDARALHLMDAAATHVMHELQDVMLAFGESDEYSFLLRRSTTLFSRRHAKILSTVLSTFTSAYVFGWHDAFGDVPLRYPPTFDARVVLYPEAKHVRDYFSWRQTDTHVNNLYNTAFWALVQQGGKTPAEAHARLRGSVAAQKHELLFAEFAINYNALDAQFRKGSILVRELIEPSPPSDASENTNAVTDAPSAEPRKPSKKPKTTVQLHHCDLIQDAFWAARPHLLAS